MIVQAALAVAVLLLVVAGGYQLWTGRLDGDDDSEELFAAEEDGLLTRGDLRNPGRILDDGAKLRNLVMICSEAAVIVLSAVVVVFLYTAYGDEVGVAFKALLTTCFVVGAYLIGRALYVRLGLSRAAGSGGSESGSGSG